MKSIVIISLPLCLISNSFFTPSYRVLNTVEIQKQTSIKNDSPSQFAAAMKLEKVLLLDVRTADEIAKGRIAGSTHLDWFDDNFVMKINAMDKTKTVLVYCAGGGRSEEASNLLLKNGFNDIHNLAEGINGWKAAGLPIEK